MTLSKVHSKGKPVLKHIMTLLTVATLAGGFFVPDAQAFSGGTTHGLGGYIPSRSSSLGREIHGDRPQLITRHRDVVLAGVGATTPALQQATRTVPIVFAQGMDPVGAGQVESLARPGRNTTGFTQTEYNLSGKWFELLREVAPAITRMGILRLDSTLAPCCALADSSPNFVQSWASDRKGRAPLGQSARLNAQAPPFPFAACQVASPVRLFTFYAALWRASAVVDASEI